MDRRIAGSIMQDLQYLGAQMDSSGSLQQKVTCLFLCAGQQETARHTESVVQWALRLADQFEADPESAATAAWLHDVSKVWSPTTQLEAAPLLGIDILPEERKAPSLIHQKISRVFAEALFDIDSPEILNAIRCHTTSRPGASRLDDITVVADKLSWQPGQAPFRRHMEKALETSLRAAVFVYLNYLWANRSEIPAVHPQMAEAYRELSRDFAPGQGPLSQV